MAGVRYYSIASDNARWDGFECRDGDIIISTPPKCGTTWTQTICALLIFQTPEFPQALDLISPWFDMLLRKREDVVADLEAQHTAGSSSPTRPSTASPTTTESRTSVWLAIRGTSRFPGTTTSTTWTSPRCSHCAIAPWDSATSPS